MHVKHYGMYVAYPPTVDLRDQGLGRHLAMFLNGAHELSDVRFTIVCPSWTKESLQELFESEQVPSQVYTLSCPAGKPYILRLYEFIKKYRKNRNRTGWFSRFSSSLAIQAKHAWRTITSRAVAVHDVRTLLVLLAFAMPSLIFVFPLAILAAPIILFSVLARWISLLSPLLTHRIQHIRWVRLVQKSALLLDKPENKDWVLGLFDEMQEREMARMQKIVEKTDALAWYCPTAFWPSFHSIKAPRLMCVPDVVLSDFPVGFASVGGERFARTFETIEKSIKLCEHFVTYSESVKWKTLVEQFGVEAKKVVVIPHAPNVLRRTVDISGFPDNELTSRYYCQSQLRNAFQRGANPAYTSLLQVGSLNFIFYASQFRPNKNVLTLLRAYEHLLRRRYIGHKLILTGNPSLMPEIGNFVSEKRLQNDVIFLPGLTATELAACYKLADLAVNPTLSEGGCPFTFTEALSVGTPVVMSRIDVAEEVLSDPVLRGVTFFDPYSWQDCAERIEWALKNKKYLLEIQSKAFDVLAERSWSDVVREHIQVLDNISNHREPLVNG